MVLNMVIIMRIFFQRKKKQNFNLNLNLKTKHKTHQHKHTNNQSEKNGEPDNHITQTNYENDKIT